VAQDQRVEFLVAAQVTGQNEMKKLIASVDALRKETEQLKSSNAGLASSTDAVIRNGVRYNNAIDAQSKALRQARQGTQQLGMQINDFATSVSTGASPIQAFNQQIGQVGIAMSQMGGVAGTVGAFFAGPFGAAIVIATMALGPLIEAFFNTSKAAEELQKAEKAGRESSINLLEAKAELDKALGKNTDNYKLAKQAAFDSAKADLAAANAAVIASQVRVGLVQKESKLIKESRAIGGVGGSFLAGVADLMGYGDVDAAVKESDKKINAYKDAQSALRKARAKLVEANKETPQTGSSTAGRMGGAVKLPKMEKIKVKPEFSMLGFYEEYFAKEFQQNDENIAKAAGDQVKAILETTAKISPEMEAIQTRTDELNQSFESLGNSVSDAFKGMLTGAMSWKDGMRSLISAVIDQLWKLFVVQKIVGLVTGALGGATGTPTGFSPTTSVTPPSGFMPGFANGTSYAPGGMALVGERGPELVNLPRGSQVIPNHKIGGLSGGGNPISISVDARGSSDPAAVRAQVQQGILEAAPAIIAAAESRTIAGLRRPRLGGAMQ
jgi:hypothetical protein